MQGRGANGCHVAAIEPVNFARHTAALERTREALSNVQLRNSPKRLEGMALISIVEIDPFDFDKPPECLDLYTVDVASSKVHGTLLLNA